MSDKNDLFTTKKIAILVIAGILSVVAYMMGVPFDMSDFVEQAEVRVMVIPAESLEADAEPESDPAEAHPEADEDAENPPVEEEDAEETSTEEGHE